MRGWSRWINYINPVGYGFEALMVNEFSGRNYDCSLLLPPFENVPATAQQCSVPGSVLGQDYVSGDAYINTSYQYYAGHKWRNIGILAGYSEFSYLNHTLFLVHR
jgi:ABC-type multidrug transport system permease subunit